MRMDLKSWIISGAVFIAAVAFTVFCGISITNMTDAKKAEEESQSSSSEETPAASSSEEQAVIIDPLPSESSEEAEVSSAEEEGPHYSSSLSSEELEEIQANYDGTVRTYYASGSREGGNRAQSCLEFEDLFLMNGIQAIVYGDYQAQEASLTYILTLEYDNYISLLLDRLSAAGVKATFFTNQGYAEQYPATIERLIADGHEIASLGASFPEGGLANFGLEDQMNDVLRFHTFMTDHYNYEMKYFYCGYDVFSLQQLVMLNKIGYTPVFYSANYLDYDHNSVIDTETFLTAMVEKAHNGVVYSFHTTNIASIDITEGLINSLRTEGYEIVPLN